ncbi:MAG TPA: four helix bundle protein [Verrucomicrobiae bacterium]
MNAPPNPAVTVPPASVRAKPNCFDHENLDVYQSELRFITWVTPLLEEAKGVAGGKTREVCDQLDRASLSCLLNTAEGNGKRRGQARARFFDDARGSATECAGCLDALVAKSVFSSDRVAEGKGLLLRIVSMLCGLVDRFDQSDGRLHEERVEYKVNVKPAESRTRTRTRMRTSTGTRTRTSTTTRGN